MLRLFKDHIQDQFPSLLTQKIGVAISGGLDSVVLAHLLHFAGAQISLLHCNFNLRGYESDGDQAFVKRLAEKLKVPFITTEFNTKAYANVHKLSIQVAARTLRYRWFLKMLKLHHLDTFVTAHHANDNLETFLINFLRGTGLEGLTGIPGAQNKCVRPLLIFTRQQLLAYAQENNLQWREDRSNADTKYLRNKLRHQVFPLLREIQPQLDKTTAKTLQYLQQSNALLQEVLQTKKTKLLVKDGATGGFKIEVNQLKTEKHQQLVIFELFQDFGFTSFKDIQNLLEAQSGKYVISPTHKLLKNREHLLLYPNNASAEENEHVAIHKGVAEVCVEGARLFINVLPITEADLAQKSNGSIMLDYEQLTFPLFVRKKQNGDYFYPLGMQGAKKVSKYFKDEKMSLIEKENTWLLASNSTILWIIGKRQDRRFQVNERTQTILQITYEKI